MKHVSAILAISLAVSGCNQATGSAVAAAPPHPSGKEIAANRGSRYCSNAELDTRLKADMDALKARASASEEQLKAQLADVQIQVKEQEFNLRKKALTEVLFDMEAQARGITRDALIAQEISAKAAVAPADIDKLWEEVKNRAQGASKEQVMPQLQQMASARKAESRLAVFQRELFKKHNVSFLGLQPARKKVTFPDDAPVLGPKDAPITIVEFTDYQCPYCQQAQQYVDRVMATYKDQVRLVYQEFPLDFHGQAKPAGVAARCAGEQGRFWEMHSSLLLSPGTYDAADLQRRAATLGIDATKFNACVGSGKYDAVIEKAIANGRSVGVTGTPTFFLNGRSFSGAQPFEVFERMIEEELAMAGSKSN